MKKALLLAGVASLFSYNAHAMMGMPSDFRPYVGVDYVYSKADYKDEASRMEDEGYLEDNFNSGVINAGIKMGDYYSIEAFYQQSTSEKGDYFIEDGMSEAIPELPYRYDKADYGRITKGLCQMILLKLYMKQHEWTKAIEIARELMKPEYGYRLYPRSSGGYPALFTIAAEQDNEIIYAVPNSTAFPNAWYPHVVAPTYPLNNEAIQKWGGYKMTWEFYWTFERGDERTTRLIAEYTGKDGLPYNEKLRGTITDLKLGVLPIKYEEDPASTGTDNQIDWIVYRYADVLLLLAEALNRANGGPTDEAFDLLNQVRRRAGLQDAVPSANFTVTTVKGTTLRPVTLSYDLTTMEGFNEFILAERGHELWFEGCRRQDLIRHGKYYEVIQKKNGYREGMSSEGRQYYPIPSWIILEGKGIILQNDPYK